MKRIKMKRGNVVWFLVVCFCLMSTLSSAATLLEWKFDNDPNDSSGNGNNGTITEGTLGSVSFVAEGRNGSIQYTDTKDRVVSPSVDISGGFTAGGWIKIADDFSGSWNRFMCTDNKTTGFVLGQDAGSGQWKFVVGGNAAVPLGGNLVPGQWQHVMGAYDGTDGRLYVDGVLVSGPVGVTAPGLANQIVLGRNSDVWENGFPGLFDEIKVYDTALSGAEVLNLYNAEYLQTVSGPSDVAVLPEIGDTAVFSIGVNKPAASNVTNVEWYKTLSDGDPNILIVDDGIKYDIVWSQASSTLTVYDVDTPDTPYQYFAVVTLDAGSPSVIQSQQATLTLSTGLVHRWSFSGDLTDSVGGANGTLYDPNGVASYVASNTQLLLDNPQAFSTAPDTALAYVELPDGIVSSLGNYMTFEMWLTPHRVISPTNWIAPLFAFGQDNDGIPRNGSGGSGFNGILQTPTSGPSIAMDIPGAYERWSDPIQATADAEIMVAIVWDGNAGTGTLYIDGVAVQGPLALPAKLSDIQDVDNLIGHNWWGNTMLNASINEVRVYDWPFEGPWIEAHYDNGPEDVLNTNPCMNRPLADLSDDCQVTLVDFSLMSAEWLDCGRLAPCQ